MHIKNTFQAIIKVLANSAVGKHFYGYYEHVYLQGISKVDFRGSLCACGASSCKKIGEVFVH